MIYRFLFAILIVLDMILLCLYIYTKEINEIKKVKDKSMGTEPVNNGNLPSNYSDNCSQASSAFSQDIPPSANANLPNMLSDNSSSPALPSNQDIPMPFISPVPQNATLQELCHTSMDFNKLVPSSHFILDNWEGKKAIGCQTLGKVKNAVTKSIDSPREQVKRSVEISLNTCLHKTASCIFASFSSCKE